MRKIRRSACQRKQIMSDQATSGLNISKYCKKIGLPASTFHTWNRKYRQKSGAAKKEGFIKIKSSAAARDGLVGIYTPEGYRIEIPTAIGEEFIAKVIQVVITQ